MPIVEYVYSDVYDDDSRRTGLWESNEELDTPVSARATDICAYGSGIEGPIVVRSRINIVSVKGQF